MPALMRFLLYSAVALSVLVAGCHGPVENNRADTARTTAAGMVAHMNECQAIRPPAPAPASQIHVELNRSELRPGEWTCIFASLTVPDGPALFVEAPAPSTRESGAGSNAGTPLFTFAVTQSRGQSTAVWFIGTALPGYDATRGGYVLPAGTHVAFPAISWDGASMSGDAPRLPPGPYDIQVNLEARSTSWDVASTAAIGLLS